MHDPSCKKKKNVLSKLFLWYPNRLTPTLVAIVLFYAYVLEHLGSGPLWNMTVRRNADFCKKDLWKNLLFIQNFFPVEQMVSSPSNKRFLWEIFTDSLIKIALLICNVSLT
jgi:hypothetical protein